MKSIKTPVAVVRYNRCHSDAYKYDSTSQEWRFLACSLDERGGMRCVADHTPVPAGGVRSAGMYKSQWQIEQSCLEDWWEKVAEAEAV